VYIIDKINFKAYRKLPTLVYLAIKVKIGSYPAVQLKLLCFKKSPY